MPNDTSEPAIDISLHKLGVYDDKWHLDITRIYEGGEQCHECFPAEEDPMPYVAMRVLTELNRFVLQEIS